MLHQGKTGRQVESVFERESSSNVLCKLSGQGSIDREVQEFVYYGRAGVLPAQDLLLERVEARLARTLPRPHSSPKEGEELEQSGCALCRERCERGRPRCRSVNKTHAQISLFSPCCINSPKPLRSSVLHIASITIAAVQKSATSQTNLITFHFSHPTSYRISVTALICCLFHFLHSLDTGVVDSSIVPLIVSCSRLSEICQIFRCVVPSICLCSRFSFYLLITYPPRGFHYMDPFLFLVISVHGTSCCTPHPYAHSMCYVSSSLSSK